MTFSELGLHDRVLRAITDEGYTTPTPIQEQAIPPVLAGNDLFGCAQTGTGKTAAFALPILHRIANAEAQRGPRVLVLAPTRELAVQIAESFSAYGKYVRFRHVVVFGGVSHRPQADAIRRGVDVVVATPGRLLDLIEQRLLHLDRIETLVLDEADRMLDMGFIIPIRQIVGMIPKKRQTLLFSATVPNEIRDLANTLLTDPVHISVSPVSSAVESVDHKVYVVDRSKKKDLLNHLLTDELEGSVLVFTRTKRGADRVVKDLAAHGLRAEALHGDKSQDARQRALGNFKTRRTRILVATDIAARGIDIDHLPYVVNYDMPETPETYVHRIGRTGRAGATGVALTLCAPEERGDMRGIERVTRITLNPVHDHPYAGRGPGPRPTPATDRLPLEGQPQARPYEDRPYQESEQRSGYGHRPQRPGFGSRGGGGGRPYGHGRPGGGHGRSEGGSGGRSDSGRPTRRPR